VSSFAIVVVGSGGRLGAALLRELGADYNVIGFNHAQLDLGDADALRASLGAHEFDFLINTAAFTNVDGCEKEPEQAFAINAEAPRVLAEICSAKRAKLIHISTDYVFDGSASAPYREEDPAEPISVYGESKREGERRVLAVDENHLVVRVSWVFGPDRPSFIDWAVEQARTKDRVEAIADKFATPTYTIDMVDLLRPFLKTEAARSGGILHLANRGECSWREYAQWALDCCVAEGVELRAREVGAITLADMKNFIARRPVYSVLDTAKYERLTGTAPRPWREAVADYVRSHVAAAAR
jgi:dTDP-4-dehydrorhamnose reductase